MFQYGGATEWFIEEILIYALNPLIVILVTNNSLGFNSIVQFTPVTDCDNTFLSYKYNY